MRHNVASLVRLMLVTDHSHVRGRDLLQLARSAQNAGITALQVRLKQETPRALVELVRALVASLDVPVLVNDRPDVALAAGAAGAHLGPDDVPVEVVRRIAPAGFIIGASVGSESEAAGAHGADYWGVGPWRETQTKGNAGVALGPAGFRKIVSLAQGKPCIAIGGVRPEDLPGVMEAGGSGVAVISGILAEDDVEAATRRYAERLQ